MAETENFQYAWRVVDRHEHGSPPQRSRGTHQSWRVLNLPGKLTAVTLAQAVGQAAPAFNADFYSVAATVIPVLFVAIAVQGRLYDIVLAAPEEVKQWLAGHLPRWLGRATLISYYISMLAMVVAAAILVYGVEGEILAVMSLYLQRPVGPHGEVETAVIVLTVMAAALPAAAFLRALPRALMEVMRPTPRAERQTASSGGLPAGPENPPAAAAPPPGEKGTGDKPALGEPAEN
jgi:hypothetical protein